MSFQIWNNKHITIITISFFSAHQTHYEQFGEVSGEVHVEGHSNIKVQIQGVRDHSYGKKIILLVSLYI